MLRGVRPDGYSKGTKQPRYRIKTLVDALERHRSKPDGRLKSDNGGGWSHEAQKLFAEVELIYDKLSADGLTLEQRREIARKEYFPKLYAMGHRMQGESGYEEMVAGPDFASAPDRSDLVLWPQMRHPLT
jgi:hypothetical protein